MALVGTAEHRLNEVKYGASGKSHTEEKDKCKAGSWKVKETKGFLARNGGSRRQGREARASFYVGLEVIGGKGKALAS